MLGTQYYSFEQNSADVVPGTFAYVEALCRWMEDYKHIRKTTAGYPVLYLLCNLFFITAFAGIVVLIATDILHHLKYTRLHQHLDAWPLIAIGLSYVTLQIASKADRIDRIKGAILGLAFFLWGGEQLLPISPMVTLMDEGAVTIFVLDVGWIIWGRLNRTDPTETSQ